MRAISNRLWAIALLLGWMFDFLFWKRQVGLNFVLYLTICLFGGLELLRAGGFRFARGSLFILVPFVFFGTATAVVQEPLTLFLAYAFSLLSLGLLANSYLGGRWYQYSLRDYLAKFLGLGGSILFLPLDDLKTTSQENARPRFLIVSVLRGLTIALPIVIFFALLLSSADAIFSQTLTDLFNAGKIIEYFARFLVILLAAWILAGTFLHAAARSRDETLFSDSSEARKKRLGLTETVIVLGSVAILFLIFVIIQFQYFFGGETNIGVQGFTYSQYARRGFSELITTAFFSLVLIMSLSALTRRDNETQRRLHITMNVVIVAEVTIMLVSAYQRLMLAIDWHGFSRLRLYPRVFMIWLGVLLAAIVILEIFRRERYFAFAFLLASFGFAASLVFFNVDVVTITHNLEGVRNGKNLNTGHLASLSTDAIPALKDAFLDPTFSAELHEGVGAILTCYLHSDMMESSDDWRSFNYSRQRAKRILTELSPLLETYRFNDKKRPIGVRAPSGVFYPCTGG